MGALEDWLKKYSNYTPGNKNTTTEQSNDDALTAWLDKYKNYTPSGAETTQPPAGAQGITYNNQNAAFENSGLSRDDFDSSVRNRNQLRAIESGIETNNSTEIANPIYFSDRFPIGPNATPTGSQTQTSNSTEIANPIYFSDRFPIGPNTIPTGNQTQTSNSTEAVPTPAEFIRSYYTQKEQQEKQQQNNPYFTYGTNKPTTLTDTEKYIQDTSDTMTELAGRIEFEGHQLPVVEDKINTYISELEALAEKVQKEPTMQNYTAYNTLYDEYQKYYADYEAFVAGYNAKVKLYNDYAERQSSASEIYNSESENYYNKWKSSVRDTFRPGSITIDNEISAVKRKIHSASNDAEKAELEAELQRLEEEKYYSDYFYYQDNQRSIEEIQNDLAQAQALPAATPDKNMRIEQLTREADYAYERISEAEDYEAGSQYNHLVLTPGTMPYVEGVTSIPPGYYDPNKKYNNETYYAMMTAEERNRYNYLYNTQGKDVAEGYFNHIKGTLADRLKGVVTEPWREYAQEHPVLSSIESIMFAPAKAFSYVDQLADFITDGEINHYSSYDLASYAPSTIREEVSSNMNYYSSLAYNAGMSMGDFLFTTAMSGGFSGGGAMSEGISLILMGGGAAADTVIASKNSGRSDEEAIALGTLAGIIEAATEKIGYEALFNTAKEGLPALTKLLNKFLKEPTAKAVSKGVTYIATNSSTEALEEGTATLLNTFADFLVSSVAGTDTDIQRKIKEFVAEGYTESEAMGIVYADWVSQLGADVLGGALSGFAMSGGSVVIGQTSNAVGQKLDVQAQIREQEQAIKNADAVISAYAEAVQKYGETSPQAKELESKAQTAYRERIRANLRLGILNKNSTEVSTQERTEEEITQLVAQAQAKSDITAETGYYTGASDTLINAAHEAKSNIKQITGRDVDIRFYQGDVNENGHYNNGIIYVNVNSGKPFSYIYGHELTHDLETSGAYAEYAEWVKTEGLGATYNTYKNDIKKRYENRGINLSELELEQEVVATWTGENLFTDDSTVKKLIKKLSDGKPSLARRIFGRLRAMVSRPRSGVTRNHYERALYLYQQMAKGGTAVAASSAQSATETAPTSFTEETAKAPQKQKNTAEAVNVPYDTTEAPEYSGIEESKANLQAQFDAGEISQEDYESAMAELEEVGTEESSQGKIKYSISPTLDDDIDSVLTGTFKSANGEVKLGETSNFLVDVIGANRLINTMPANKMYAAIVTEEQAKAEGRYSPKYNYHGLGKDTFKKILNESENPVVAFAAPSGIDGNNRDNRIVLVTSVSVDEGEAVVIVEMDAKAVYQNKNISANKTITVYGRDTIRNDIRQAITDGRILYYDKKRAPTVYPVRKGSNSLTAIGKQELTNNISNFWANVNWKNKNSDYFGGKTQFSLEDPTRDDVISSLKQYISGSLSKDQMRDIITKVKKNPESEIYSGKSKHPKYSEGMQKILRDAFNSGMSVRDYIGQNYDSFEVDGRLSNDALAALDFAGEGRKYSLEDRAEYKRNPDGSVRSIQELDRLVEEMEPIDTSDRYKTDFDRWYERTEREDALRKQMDEIATAPVSENEISTTLEELASDLENGYITPDAALEVVEGLRAEANRGSGVKYSFDEVLPSDVVIDERAELERQIEDARAEQNALINEASNLGTQFDQVLISTDEYQSKIGEIKQRFEAAQSRVDNLTYRLNALENSETAERTPIDSKSLKQLVKVLGDELSLKKVEKEALAQLIQDFSTGKYATKAELYEAVKEGFDTHYYTERNDVIAEIKATLRDMPIKVSDDIKFNAGYMSGGYGAFVKSNFGRLRFSKNGRGVDSVYQELNSLYPVQFPDDIINPSEQLQQIARVASLPKDEVRAVPLGDEAMQNITDYIYDSVLEYHEAEKHDASMREKYQINNNQEAVEAQKLAKSLQSKIQRLENRLQLTEEQKALALDILSGDKSITALEGDSNVEGMLEYISLLRESERMAEAWKNWRVEKRGEYQRQAEEMYRLFDSSVESGFKLDKNGNIKKDRHGNPKTVAEKTNKSGIRYQRETQERITFDVFSKDKAQEARKFNDWLFAPERASEAQSNRYKNQMRGEVRKLELNRKVEEGNQVSESAAVQLLGELQDIIRRTHRQADMGNADIYRVNGLTYNEAVAAINDLKLQNPNMDFAENGKIQTAIDKFGELYAELLSDMNDALVRNGYAPVPARSGYFPHFADEGDTLIQKIGRALGIDTDVSVLPTGINGLTHTFKPGKTWFANALERKGNKTAYDAVLGFDKYIEGAANVIFHTDNIQRQRYFARAIRYNASDEAIKTKISEIIENDTLSEEEKDLQIQAVMSRGKFKHSTYVVQLEDHTNSLAGKKTFADRDMERLLGRKAYTWINNMEGRVAANMIPGNITSALSNFIPIESCLAEIGPVHTICAAAETIKVLLKCDDGFKDRSDFLTNRYGSELLTKNDSTLNKVSNTLSIPMEAVDHVTSQVLVRAAYHKYVKKGASPELAMKKADLWAAGVMADRSRGALPQIFENKNPLYKAFTMFQVEPNNYLSHIMKDIPREHRDEWAGAVALILAKLFFAIWLCNDISEKLTGRRMADTDVISTLNETVGDLFGKKLPNTVDLFPAILRKIFRGDDISEMFETNKVGAGQAVLNLVDTAAEDVPFVGNFAGGGELPVGSAMPDLSKILPLIGSDKDDENIKQTLSEELLKPASYMLLPFGANQLSKTAKGHWALREGGSYKTNSAGEEILQYPIYAENGFESALNFAQATLFGKSSLPEAQEWVENDFNSLSVKGTVAYKGMIAAGVPEGDAYDLVIDIASASADDPETVDKVLSYRGIVDRTFSETVGDGPSTNEIQCAILRNSDISGEGKAILFYTMLASESECELMISLQEEGADMVAVTEELLDNSMNASDRKYSAITSSGLSFDEQLWQMYKLDTSAGKSTHKKYYTAYQTFKITPAEYRTAVSFINDYLGGASMTNARAEAAINEYAENVPLTITEKAALWQIISGSTSAKNNPFSVSAGEKAVKAMAEYDEEEREFYAKYGLNTQ